MDAFSPICAVAAIAGEGVNARRGLWRLIEERQGASEVEIGIGGDERGDAFVWLGGENGSGVRVADFVRVLGVGQKGEMRGFGMFDARDAGDFDVSVAVQFTREGLGYLGELHLKYQGSAKTLGRE